MPLPSNTNTPLQPQQPAPGVQNVISNLQNLVTAVNALTQMLTSQFGTTSAYTVANLPTVKQGARAFVTDSTVVASGNFGAAVVGGGGYYVPVYYDNTSWKIG